MKSTKLLRKIFIPDNIHSMFIGTNKIKIHIAKV